MKDSIEIVYGFHAVSSFIRQSPNRIQTIYLDNAKKDPRMLKFIAQLKDKKIKYYLTGRDLFKKKLGDVVHQGVMADVSSATKRQSVDLESILPNVSDSETMLVLDGVQDPANLGACLRCADAAGVSHVVLPKDKSSTVTPVVRKVAAGAAETLNIITVTNLVRTLETLKQHQFWVIGLADETDTNIYNYKFNGRVALVLGNEGRGLRRLTRDACDEILAIPMRGQVESLNVSVAAGVSLFEIARQRNALK